jgi:hypothetical protein
MQEVDCSASTRMWRTSMYNTPQGKYPSREDPNALESSSSRSRGSFQELTAD